MTRYGTGLPKLFFLIRRRAAICDTIAVMRHGAIVEVGPSGRVLMAPSVAYTRALIAAIPGNRIFKTSPQEQ